MNSCMTHRLTFLAMAKAAAVCNCALRFAFAAKLLGCFFQNVGVLSLILRT